MKKRLPLGLSNFKKLIEDGYYFVDKSLLIKEIHEQTGTVVLIPRPRRFGKTLNLSMLRFFYDLSGGSTAHLFEQLKIWEHEEYRALQGTHPVIYVTFKNIVHTSYEAMIKKFAYIIAKEFERHAILLSSSELSVHEKKTFERFRAKEVPESELGDGLEFLLEMLFKHYKKEVIVLIDEYDVPVQHAFIYGFYDKIIPFLKALLTGVLKDQDRLEKGILTGIMTLAKAGIFTGLNNLAIYDITNPQLADKFGFTHDEASAFLRYYNIADVEVIQQWYNGYIFGHTKGIYNPWSMLQCAHNDGGLKIYWANTSDNILLKRLIARSSSSTKEELELLLKGQSVKKIIEESVVYPDIDTRQDLIWSVLLYTGYLTSQSYELEEGKTVCSLIIPNKEVKFLYQDLIKKLFADAVAGVSVHDFLKALIEGNTKIFSHLLQGFILKSMSVHDLSSSEPEKSYHLFILGLLVLLKDDYEVTSNRESGLGRYDILIVPKQKNRTAIVIEFKKVWGNAEDGLEKAAQKALDQIIERKYAQELYDQGINAIRAYGIAFLGKNIAIKSCNLEKPELEC